MAPKPIVSGSDDHAFASCDDLQAEGRDMGEAKQRKHRAAGAHDRLTAEFTATGIDPSSFGFYDQPAFLAR